MTGREIGAWISAAAALLTAGGGAVIQTRDLGICAENHSALLETHTRVVMELVHGDGQ